MKYETEEQYQDVDITVLVPEEEQKNYFFSPGRVEKVSELDQLSIPKRYKNHIVQTGYYALNR